MEEWKGDKKWMKGGRGKVEKGKEVGEKWRGERR